MTVERAAGWGMMVLMLAILSDIPATSQVAVAFAWLILLSIGLLYGPTAVTNFMTFLGVGTSEPQPLAKAHQSTPA